MSVLFCLIDVDLQRSAQGAVGDLPGASAIGMPRGWEEANNLVQLHDLVLEEVGIFRFHQERWWVVVTVGVVVGVWCTGRRVKGWLSSSWRLELFRLVRVYGTRSPTASSGAWSTTCWALWTTPTRGCNRPLAARPRPHSHELSFNILFSASNSYCSKWWPAILPPPVLTPLERVASVPALQRISGIEDSEDVLQP